MNRDEARRHTIRLMDEHELAPGHDWTFIWIRTKRVLGRCNYRDRTIALSLPFVDVNDLPTVEQTILHEIAHAIAGPGTGHGVEWQRIARSIGVKNPSSKCGPDEVTLPDGRYQATCETCGNVSHRHRMTKRMRNREFACAPCCRKFTGGKFDDRYRLTWEDTHAPTKRVPEPETPANEPVAAQSVETLDESTKTSWTASEIASALKVDSKQFRAWLRKTGSLFGKKDPQSGRYVFNEHDVREIVHVWSQMNR